MAGTDNVADALLSSAAPQNRTFRHGLVTLANAEDNVGKPAVSRTIGLHRTLGYLVALGALSPFVCTHFFDMAQSYRSSIGVGEIL